MRQRRFLIGIDEAGRGPLAGPVAVGAVMVPKDFDWKQVSGVRDSKKLTPRSRAEWNRELQNLRRAGKLDFSVSFSSARRIDMRGIVFSIRSALEQCLKRLDANPASCEILLDGSLRAPDIFARQKTIIHGDDIEPIISMASIIAKVRRDALMKKLSARHPRYGFDSHKGYGTKAHRVSIKKYGLCDLHRRSFCTKLMKSNIKKQNAK